MPLLQALRKLVRRDVLTICLVIFSADLVTGLLSPTFSLYAESLGASLAMIGFLSSVVGLTQLITSMPISVQSDKSGRKIVLTFGMLGFGLATLLFAISPNAYFLFPGRVLMGLASVSTFSVGIAYVADIVAPEERGLAYGMYSTSMGTGFAIGPLIGTAITVQYGLAASYLVATGLALAGAILAAKGLRTIRHSDEIPNAQRPRLDWSQVACVIRDPSIIVGSLAHAIMSTSFSGAIVNFFPMYSAQLGLSQATINSMFSLRAFGSAAARLPTGAITQRLSSRMVMGLALLLAMMAVLAMSQTNEPWILGLLLLMEGVGFGMFLTSGQAYIAEFSTVTTRGTSVGVYNTAGSLGSTLSPIALGMFAELWGVQMVFRLTGGLIFAGLLGISGLYAWKMRSRPVAIEAVDEGDSTIAK